MASRFYQQAQWDLKAARALMSPDLYFAAVYHAEQAAEKALKAAHWHLLAEEPA